MAKPEWGTKRHCQSCGAKYYDFNKSPIICPACGTAFDPEAILKARRPRPSAQPKKERVVPIAGAELADAAVEAEEEVVEDAELAEADIEEENVESDEEVPDKVEEADEEDLGDDDDNKLIEDTSELGEDEDVEDLIDEEDKEDR